MEKITLNLFLIAVFFSSMLYGQSKLEKGLVGYYNMDEADGEVLTNLATGTDIMPDGVIINPVWSDTAVFGSALYFDVEANMPDETPSYVDFGTYDPAQGGGKFTFSCWFYWNGTNGEYQGLSAKRDDWTESTVYWDICLKRDGPIQFEAVGPQEVKQVLLSDNAPLIRTWQNLTITYDGTTAIMYMDGNLIKQIDMKLGLKKDAAFMLGCAEPLGVTPFTGHIDEVRYYNRVLPMQEVSLLYDYPSSLVSAKEFTNNEMKIFPNPVATELKVKGQDLKSITIYDNTGKMVIVENVEGNLARVNVSELKQGIYFIKVSGKNEYSAKFMKK